MHRLRWQRLRFFVPLIVVGVLVTLMGCQTFGRPVTTADLIDYTDAASGLGYPRSPQQLLAYRDAQDVAAMRRHGWDIWGAVTQLVPSGFPIFLTWYQASEVFSAEPRRDRRLFTPAFRVPAPKADGAGGDVLSFTAYNVALRDHLRQHDPQRLVTLTALVSRESGIAPFPETAMAVQTMWWPVRANTLTALPVWDHASTRPLGSEVVNHLRPTPQAEPGTLARPGNEGETMARVVAIDPTRTEVPRGESAEVLLFDPDDLTQQAIVKRAARVVPIRQFFAVQVNDRHTVELINSLPLSNHITTRLWKRPFRLGDYVVLVAVHVTTHEIPGWVWATFWWHDEPDAAPFGGDRPKTIGNVFRHYLMRVDYHHVH